MSKRLPKSFKRLLALFMVVLLLGSVGLVGCTKNGNDKQGTISDPAPTPSKGTDTEVSSEYPDYLNLESTWPVVKEGHDVTISMWITQSESHGGDFEENWYLQYLVDKSNINIEFTQIMSDQIEEQKNLVMNSGNLPDVIYGFGFTPTELVSYGQDQGLLLKLNEYINGELTPNMTAAFEKVPTARRLVTLPDDGIYSIPRIDSDLNEGGVNRHFINTKWLEGIEREIPETLDELVEVLYLFKNEDPGGIGKENVVPIGSADSYWATISDYLLNAFGFVRPGAGTAPDLRNGEIVVPGGTEVYLEYLKLMNQFYKDGIISPDFYTMDGAALKALIASDRTGLITEPAYVFTGAEGNWEDWWAVKPLTSEHNPNQQWGSYYGYILAGMVISADTEYPEAIMRMADWFFTKQNAVYVRRGPFKDTEDTYGLFETGWHLDEDGVTMYYGDIPSEEFPNKGLLFTPAHNESVGVTSNFWLVDGMTSDNILQEWAGMELSDPGFDLKNPDQHYRASVTENLMPYCVESLPSQFLYFDAEQNAEISDISTVLDTHIRTESAKFVTGQRDLSEFDKYLSELESLGLPKLIEYYTEAWETYKAN